MAMDMSVAMRIAASVTGGSSVDDLRKSVDNLNRSAGGIEGAFRTAGMVIKGFIGIEAIRQVANYSMNIISLGDQLDELSQRTGVSATSLSSLSQSAQQSGVSLDGVATGMKKLGITLSQAQAGNKDAMKFFDALRLDPRQFKTTEEALYAVANRMKDMEDGADKVAIAQAGMGKSGEALIPWLNQGAEAMRKYGSIVTPQFVGMSAQFSDQLDEMGFNAKKFGASVLEGLLPALNDVIKSFNTGKSSASDFSIFIDAVAEGLRLIAAAAHMALTSFKQFLEIVNTGIDWAKLFGTGNFDAAGKRLEQGYNKVLQIGTEGNEKIKELMRNSLIFGDGNARQRGIEESGGAGGQKPKSTPFTPNMSVFASDKRVAKTIEEQEAERIDKFIVAQNRAIEKRKDELKAVDMTTVAFQQMMAVKELEARSAELAAGMTEANAERLRNETEELKKKTQATIELEYQTKRSFEYGMKSAIKSYADEITNIGKQTQDVMTKAFKGIEDALVQFVMSGKLNFKDLANSIIQDLMRIAIRTAIVKPILGSFGITAFANGGIMTGAGEVPLRKYAMGGIANTPQLAMFGEGSTPEAYVPLPDGRTIPVTMTGNGGTNNVTVNVSVDGNNTSVQSDTTEAQRLGTAISKAVQNEIVKQKRPGGLLYTGA